MGFFLIVQEEVTCKMAGIHLTMGGTDGTGTFFKQQEIRF